MKVRAVRVVRSHGWGGNYTYGTCEMDAVFGAEIWLLDDDPAVLSSYQLLLELNGYRACGFLRAEQLLNANCSSTPDCILIDWLLPKPEGLRVAARCMRRWPSVPVLLISGQATVPLAVEAVRQGLMGSLRRRRVQKSF